MQHALPQRHTEKSRRMDTQCLQNNGCIFLMYTDRLLQNAFSIYKTKNVVHAAQLETIC